MLSLCRHGDMECGHVNMQASTDKQIRNTIFSCYCGHVSSFMSVLCSHLRHHGRESAVTASSIKSNCTLWGKYSAGDAGLRGKLLSKAI